MTISCSTSSVEHDYTRIVEQWQGREIKLPDVMTDALTGDTIDLSDADFTIFTYVDSTGCTSCKMKLAIWKEFLCTFDTLTEVNVNTVMVVHPKDERDIIYLLKRYEYDYPVFIDLEDKINAENKFPEELPFQSFLLDASGRILAIGSPVYRSGISEFYKALITGEKTLSLSQNAIINISHHNMDIGSFRAGDVIIRHFSITNNSKNDTIAINKVISSCECTHVSFSSDRILPMSSIDATVEIQDSIIGDFNSSIHIYYNGFDYPSIVQINGKIL